MLLISLAVLAVAVSDVWSKEKPLNLYQLSDVKFIWDDAGSGASADCSIWRAETKDGYYSLGDIVVASHSKPTSAYIVKPSDPEDNDSVRPPASYSPIWSDSGSGAYRDVAIWRANCPEGFVALGNVATSGGYPSPGDIYCVNRHYTSAGSNNAHSWRYIWADLGSGANSDVAMYEEVAASNSQQTVRGFGAIARYNAYPGTPYLLNKDSHTFYAEKPIVKIYMYNVQYDLDSVRVQSKPFNMFSTVFENHSDQEHTVSRDSVFSLADSSTFTFSQVIEVGVTTELSGGIPVIDTSGTIWISDESTTTFSVGSTTTTTRTDSIPVRVTLPGRSKLTASIIGTEYTADVPFTATIKKVYYDYDTFGYGEVSGVYEGVGVNGVRVEYGEIEYFD